MILNTHSYCHVKIRQLCFQLEALSGMTMVTNLNEEFNQLVFKDRFGYIVLDKRKNACLTLSHRLTRAETDTIDDIMTYWRWLESGEKTEKMLHRQKRKPCNKNVTNKFARNTLQEKND